MPNGHDGWRGPETHLMTEAEKEKRRHDYFAEKEIELKESVRIAHLPLCRIKGEEAEKCRFARSYYVDTYYRAPKFVIKCDSRENCKGVVPGSDSGIIRSISEKRVFPPESEHK